LTSHALPSTVVALAELIAASAATDIVVALGSSFVPDINRDLDHAMQQHLGGALQVIDAVSRLSTPLAGKILMVGSASEYGEFDDAPVDELHPARPRDHYGHLKLTLRQLGLYYHVHHGLPVIHVRQFNVTGIGQDPRFVLPSICRQVAQAQKSNTSDAVHRIIAGNTAVRRDFLAVEDVCEAYRTLMLTGAPGNVYNVCSGHAHKIADLIVMAADIANIRIEVEVDSQLLRENDKVQEIICGDPGKLKHLGWQPKVQMRELLAEMITNYSTAAGSAPSASAKI
jgi:GDP-4-dehydro-6-deoxy-D-mannose reductase